MTRYCRASPGARTPRLTEANAATVVLLSVRGATVMDPDDRMIGQQTELLASRRPGAEEMDAYERVLGDAMAGDRTLFAREDYVEEAWRIVDPALQADTPVHEYEPGSWGPPEVDAQLSPPGGWQNPVVTP